MRSYALPLVLLSMLLASASARAQNSPVVVSVDAAAGRRAISPNVYGIAHASSTALADLNVPLNRSGGR